MNGLELITPTSVSGAGVSLTGAKVVFTAAASVSVNGVFDGTYDNYLVVARMVQTVSPPTFGSLYGQFTASGSQVSTGYTNQRLRADNTTVQGLRFTGSSFQVGDIWGGLQNGLHVYFYGPYLSQPTALRSISASAKDTATIADYAATHSTAAAYDGFRLHDDGVGRAFTGALTVYGFTKQSVV